MGKLIYLILSFFGSEFIRNALIGAGVGLASSAFLLSLVQKFTQRSYSLIQSSANSSDIWALLGLGGFDVAMSVVIGALITRATIQSLSLHFSKSS